jgi:SAM-dependent methyltransferase
MSRLVAALDVWGAGLRTGLGTVRAEPVLGLKRLLLPVSYWRTAEFGYALRQLQLPRGARLLDLGSPKELAFILARRRAFEIVATDILPEAIDLTRRYALAQGVLGHAAGRVSSEVQDGRALTYPDGSFDAAFAVSVVEHIPDDGDTAAMRELIRVVKPGGLIVITTPYGTAYRETFVQRRVYEREQEGNKPIFFERHYDREALERRLLSAGGARVVDLELWGEGTIRMERILSRLGRLRDVLSPFEAVLSATCLRPVSGGQAAHPMAAFFTLQKLP